MVPRRTRAHTRARACRHRKNRRGDCHWPKVAVEIAKRTGREIGIKATDRYERDSRPAPRLRHVHEAALRATPIIAILTDLARDKGSEVSLQNVAPTCATPWSHEHRPGDRERRRRGLPPRSAAGCRGPAIGRADPARRLFTGSPRCDTSCGVVSGDPGARSAPTLLDPITDVNRSAPTASTFELDRLAAGER